MAFSHQNFFWIKYILNFFIMNEIYVLIDLVLDKLIFLNMQFNYIPTFHKANFLSFYWKKGRYKALFLKPQKLALWNDGI